MAHKWDINTDLIQGDKLNLWIVTGSTEGGYDVLAYATSCSVQVDQETIDTSSKFSCRWNATRGGRSSYTISADALYTNATGVTSFDTLLDLMLGDKNVKWAIGQEVEYKVTDTNTCEDNPHTLDTSKMYYTGEALISSVSLEAGNNEIASCSISMTGSGAIVPVTPA